MTDAMDAFTTESRVTNLEFMFHSLSNSLEARLKTIENALDKQLEVNLAVSEMLLELAKKAGEEAK